MSKAKTVIVNELRELVPAMVFFLVGFHMLSMTKALMEGSRPLSALASTLATVAALIVAKTILLLDHTAIARWFSGRLLNNLLWKTLLFGTVALILREVEDLIPVMTQHGDMAAAIREHYASMSLNRFLVIHMWLYTLVFIYAIGSEAVRIVGAKGAWATLMAPVRPRSAERPA